MMMKTLGFFICLKTTAMNIEHQIVASVVYLSVLANYHYSPCDSSTRSACRPMRQSVDGPSSLTQMRPKNPPPRSASDWPEFQRKADMDGDTPSGDSQPG
jgi:hypothetical protein